jgi:hypothetical protein
MLGGLVLFVAASLASGLAQARASWSERGRCRAGGRDRGYDDARADRSNS